MYRSFLTGICQVIPYRVINMTAISDDDTIFLEDIYLVSEDRQYNENQRQQRGFYTYQDLRYDFVYNCLYIYIY